MPVQDTMANPSRLLPDEELGRPLASSRQKCRFPRRQYLRYTRRRGGRRAHQSQIADQWICREQRWVGSGHDAL